MICTISPKIARAEMYKLGYIVEHDPPRLSLNSPPIIETSSTLVVRAVVLGSMNSRKRGLVHKLHQWQSPRRDEMESEYPATSSSVSKIIRSSSRCRTTGQDDETTVHLILTEVPAVDLSRDTERINLRARMDKILGRGRSGKRPYDMAVLSFDATSMQSLEFAKELERSVLFETMPRVFVGTTTEEIGTESYPSIEALRHCKHTDLEPPIFVSLDSESNSDSIFLEHMVDCALNKRQDNVTFRSTPHGEKKRVVAKRMKILWIGGLVTASISVVLGFTFGGKKEKSSSTQEKGGFVRFFRALLPFAI
jgi:hypothetical protein